MIVKCAECGQDVSSDAKVCPHCGVSLKKSFFKTLGSCLKKSFWQLFHDPQAFFSLQGSTTRTELLAVCLISPTLPLLAHVPLVMLASDSPRLIVASTIFVAILSCLQYPALIRRCHSIGMSGKIILVLLAFCIILGSTLIGRFMSLVWLVFFILKPIAEDKQYKENESPQLYFILIALYVSVSVVTSLSALNLLRAHISLYH